MELTKEEEQAHNAKMLKAAEGGEEEENPDTSNKELPEGVSMEDLLAMYKTKQEADEASKTHEQDTETGDEGDSKEGDEGDQADDTAPTSEDRIKSLEDELVQTKIFNEAGSEEAYNALRKQAEETLSDAQLSLMNTAITEGSAEQATAAVQLMKTMFSSATNQDAPKELNAQHLEGTTTPSSNSFQDEGDFTAALENPLYKQMNQRGEKYRKEVTRKLSNSNF
jgi:hypothetical protein